MRENQAFAEALRLAMTDRGVTLSQLRDRLMDHGNPVSVSALGYWRAGKRTPEGAKSLAAVAGMEEILHLGSGALSALLPPSARVGAPSPIRIPEVIGSVTDSIDEIGQLLLSQSLDNVRPVSVQIVADVDARGVVVRQRQRIRIQAVRTPMTEFARVEMTYVPSAVAPVFSARYGCRVARTISRASADAFGCLFALDRAVPVGRSTILEFQMDYPEGYPEERECGYASGRRTHEVVLWVQFAEGATPTWIEETEVIDGVETRRRRQLDAGAVHAERIDFPVGVLALRWG
ncbi:hypothetical protein GCM10027421_36290 [Microbacterium shaanxiense]